MRDESEDEEYAAQAKIIAEKLGFHYYFAEAIRFDDKNPYGIQELTQNVMDNNYNE